MATLVVTERAKTEAKQETQRKRGGGAAGQVGHSTAQLPAWDQGEGAGGGRAYKRSVSRRRSAKDRRAAPDDHISSARLQAIVRDTEGGRRTKGMSTTAVAEGSNTAILSAR